MPKQSTYRKALAQHMDARRRTLGMRWADVATEAKLTTEGLREIRNGAVTEIRPLSKEGIERALTWKQGSVDDILAGGEPTVIEVNVGRDADTSPLRSELHRTVDRIGDADLLDAIIALRPFIDS